MMLQQWPTDVIILPGFFIKDSNVDGTDLLFKFRLLSYVLVEMKDLFFK